MQRRSWCGAAALVGAILIISAAAARGDQPQNTAVQADSATLTAGGFGTFGVFGPLNGELVTVGDIEAGGGLANLSSANVNTSPGSTLPNGNPDLPSSHVQDFQFVGNILPAGGVNSAGGPGGNPYPAGLVVDNHASEVTGVVVGQGTNAAVDTGIAPGAVVQEAGITGAANAPNGYADLIQRSIQNGASIVNLSLGANVTPNNNGQSIRSQFLDWAAGRYNVLFTVAGNEAAAEVDTPADAYNGITVGATGSRTSYDQAAANLNVSTNGFVNANRTSDGRIGVTLVAPGGDAGPGAGNVGTFNALPAFDNQFQTTAGGQFQYSSTNGGGVKFYDQDSFNGGASSAANGSAGDNTAPFIAGTPPSNPGANLGAGDFVQSSTLAGTSFAAPLVAGAGAVVSQYGLLATATNANSNIGNFAFSRNATDPLDHRVLKAILMNGASKYNVDGTLLTRSTGTAWTRSGVLQGAKALPAPLLALAVGPTSAQAQSGLDPQLGTGQLNLLHSLTNYAAGEQGPGAPGAANVLPIGWDYETVAANAAANTMYTYNFSYGGSPTAAFSASLAWDAPVTINNPGAGNSFQVSGTAATTSTFNATAAPADLDLYFFQVNPNGTLLELGFSNSNLDNMEHIYDLPTDGLGNLVGLAAGNYQLDVVAPGGIGAAAVPYGLAWSFASVPEPGAATMLGIGLIAASLRRRRRRAA